MNKEKLLELYKTKELNIQECLKTTESEYRTLDPGSYLYKKVLEYKYEDKFSHEFIELVYVTLAAWNMNSRGAKLSNYDQFEKSVLDNKDFFDKLNSKKLEELEEDDYDNLRLLFDKLKLVASRTPLVTFSKTMHFFLPETVGPIDRKYTLKFYKGNTNVPGKFESQFELYKEIHEGYSNFANIVDLTKYIKKDGWNRSVPKIIDNIIIGYQK